MAAFGPARTAGRLRHVVRIRERHEAADGFGGVTVTLTTLFTTHAEIRPLRGAELERARQIQADVTHMVTLRYRPGITAKMDVLYQGRTLNIVAALNEDERGRWLDCLCKEYPTGA